MSEIIEEKNTLSDLSKTTLSILAGIIILLGGTSGGIVSKVVAPTTSGLSQDKADVRYVTKEESAKQSQLLQEQLKKIDTEMVKRDLFANDSKHTEKRLDKIEKMLEELLKKSN